MQTTHSAPLYFVLVYHSFFMVAISFPAFFLCFWTCFLCNPIFFSYRFPFILCNSPIFPKIGGTGACICPAALPFPGLEGDFGKSAGILPLPFPAALPWLPVFFHNFDIPLASSSVQCYNGWQYIILRSWSIRGPGQLYIIFVFLACIRLLRLQ